jgi:hypothetical protein
MKYILLLLALILNTSLSPAYGYGSALSLQSEEISITSNSINLANPVKPAKQSKKKKKKALASANTPLFLMKIAVYLSAIAGLCIIFLLFQPIFIFAILFFIGFLWGISGMAASLSFIAMLIRASSNFKEQNEELAAYVLLFSLSRIIIVTILFLTVDFIIALVIAISFVPALIVHILIISLLLSTHRSKIFEKDMFRFKKTELND